MRYLVRLVTPKDGIVLDPFAGTGTTGEACILEDRNYYLIEAEESYIKDIENRTNKYNRLGL
jgi:site-specific DNA-methyltransferase (adenine-specific)